MKKVVVVGAGAAGNFVSSAIKRNCPHLDVILIYDPNTPIAGVGEGLQFNSSTFFKKVLGIERSISWIKESRSIARVGTKFQGWDGTDTVFHTNTTMVPGINILDDFKKHGLDGIDPSHDHRGYERYTMLDVWLDLKNKGALSKLNYRTPKDLYAGHNSRQYWFSRNERVPYNKKTGEWMMRDGTYGHHINAAYIGGVVQKLVGAPAGVREIPIAIKNVELTEKGDIKHLVLADDSTVTGDLFFDCSGFARVLCKHLPYKFVHMNDTFNNRCIVGPHNYTGDHERTANTYIRAMDQGWHFSVAMDVRSGEGYVFNSNVVTDVDSLKEEYYRKSNKTDVNFRMLAWEPGYQEKSFVNNCITLGLSHGIIDAFDGNAFSSALGKLELLVDLLKADPALTFTWREKFNQYANMRMRDTIMRIKYAFHLCKYDSPYWQSMRDVGVKEKTLEQLYSTINDPIRNPASAELVSSATLWKRPIWVSQATYYDIPVDVKLDVEYDEDLAIDYFNQLGQQCQEMSMSGPTTAEFYKMLYPLDK